MSENDFPAELKYTKEHEWVSVVGDEVLIGITEYAQSALGDIVYVELPAEGDTLSQEESFGSVEAVKAVSELYSPVGGVVIEVNAVIEADPGVVNRSPYEDGWMIRARLTDTSEIDGLLTAEDYEGFVSDLETGE